MIKSKLAKTLEKEGFEETGGSTLFVPEKNEESRYLTLDILLKTAISQGYKNIAINLSNVEGTPNYFLNIYGKK